MCDGREERVFLWPGMVPGVRGDGGKPRVGGGGARRGAAPGL